MTTITLQEAQATLPDLVRQLAQGEEVVLTENNVPVAKLVATASPQRPIPKLGTQRGSALSMTPDFDAPLEDRMGSRVERVGFAWERGKVRQP